MNDRSPSSIISDRESTDAEIKDAIKRLSKKEAEFWMRYVNRRTGVAPPMAAHLERVRRLMGLD